MSLLSYCERFKNLLGKNRLKFSLVVNRGEFGLAANVPESFCAVTTKKLDVIFTVKMETKQLYETSVLSSNVRRPIARQHLTISVIKISRKS
jgi:hypothetical protein